MSSQIFNLSSYYYNAWAVPVFFVAIIVMLIGAYIWSTNKRSLTNIFYFLVCLSTGIWLFGTVGMFSSREVSLGLFWNKIIWMGVPFISTSVYAYSVSWLQLEKQKKIVVAGYILAFIFAFLAVTSKYFISGGRMHFWGVYPEYGIISYIFLLFHFGLMIGSFVNFIVNYKQTISFIRKKQIRYVSFAFILAYMASVDYLPALKIEVYPCGYVFIALFLCTIAFTIIRYRLMDIDTVIHRTFLWVITSIAVFLPIFGIIYFSRDFIHNLSRFYLSLVLTGLFFVIVYYYKKVQPKIDHIFRRRKYDYYLVLGEIGQKIGSELDIEQIAIRLFKELKDILYIRNGILFVQDAEKKNYAEMGNICYEHPKEGKSGAVLDSAGRLGQWISGNGKALEREQIEVDPQYQSIKKEALAWFGQNMIEVLVPVLMEGKVNGLVGIGKKENLQAYTVMDIELLEKLGRQIGVTIDNAMHHEDIVEKERLAEELKLGREIQKNLLPKATPIIDGLVLQGLMIPAKEIGGDYYDYISTIHYADGDKHSRVGIVIGDVSGKGVAAGLIMATAKATLKGLSQQDLTPKQILSQANNMLFEYTDGQKFMTLLYFQYREKDRTLKYSSAGHEHILIYRQHTQKVEAVQSGGFMLGMIPDTEHFLEEKQLHLNPKDKILLYTDGVTEAENEAGARFNLDRLKEALQKHGSRPADELMQAIKEEVYAFIGTHPQYDDITLVVMEAA